MWHWCTLILVFIRCLSARDRTDSVNGAVCRDARTWPFLSSSIWNTPIGSGAVFHDPGLFRPPFSLPRNFFSDDDYFIVATSADPLTPWFNQGWWGKPGGEAHCNVTGPLIKNIHFPVNMTVRAFTDNNAAALLQPDNRTIINTQPLFRCTPGSPVLSLLKGGQKGKDDIVSGNGTWGAHGGSGLSSIGGTIRLGELLPDTPSIQHALKLQLLGSTYYYDQPPGYIWPALNCDHNAFNQTNPGHYGGKDIHVSPGALLAIPSNITVNVTTIPGRKLLFALQNYGGYLCDNTAANRGTINTEHGVMAEFQSTYGYAFNSTATGEGAEWYADMLALFQSLHVVINNSESSIGGGGTPLQPPPPPICSI